MIVVTGASGQLGRRVVTSLLGRVSADQLGVSVRDPGKVADLRERGVRVRQGDFTDPASLAHAFQGATRILLVSAGTTGPRAMDQHRTAIEAAVAAGAGRIVYTSHMGADAASPFPPMPDHAATEDLLRATGVPYTALRNGFYASFATVLLGDALETGELIGPQDGPVAWTDHDDLAEAAAHALVGDPVDGPTAPLTAGEAVDLAGIASIASRSSGRPVRRVTESDDDHRARLLARGLPVPAVDLLIGMFAASRRGDFAAVDPTLGALLGRPPVALVDVLDAAVGKAA